MVSATAPLPARLELVVTDINTSFLASFRHRDLRKAVVREGLLVKVSAETLHYTCYLHCNYVIFTVIMYFNAGTSLRLCRVCESDYRRAVCSIGCGGGWETDGPRYSWDRHAV